MWNIADYCWEGEAEIVTILVLVTLPPCITGSVEMTVIIVTKFLSSSRLALIGMYSIYHTFVETLP